MQACDKAVSEQGARLYIRKPMLREWRRDFAACLREFGVEANATGRAVRGETRSAKRDAIQRAMLRNASTQMRERSELVACELRSGGLKPEPGKAVLVETRQEVLEGWRNLSIILERQGESRLAATVRRFAEAMPPPWTEKEHAAHQIRAQIAAHGTKEQSLTR